MEQILSFAVVQSAPEWTPQVIASLITALTTLIGALAGLVVLFKRTENIKTTAKSNKHQVDINSTRLANVEKLVNASGTTKVKPNSEL